MLVTAVPLSTEQRALLADRGTQVIEAAPGSALHTWLTDGKAAAALVRPDFTVMRAGRDVDRTLSGGPHVPAATRPRPVAHTERWKGRLGPGVGLQRHLSVNRFGSARIRNLRSSLTQNVTQNSAGSQFRNTPTGPALARPHACDLRKHLT